MKLPNGLIVDVEHATDTQFQAFIASCGVPVDEADITEWLFDDRVGVINYALRNGIALPFVE